MEQVPIGAVRVSRLCVGGNPFSGFSHQTPARDREMRAYFTPQRIWAFLDEAQALGINTVFARVDDHILGVLGEYFRRGGQVQWFAQVCADVGQGDSGNESWKQWMKRAVDGGATGLYVHGGLAEYWQGRGQFEKFHEALAIMRGFGKACGFAGHRPDLHQWISEHLDCDFQMCAHYNPTDRQQSPHHSNVGEKWDDADRAAMLKVVAPLPRPVVHYKIFAGGNKPIDQAFVTLGKAMRPGDVACIGVYPGDDARMLAKDVALFDRHVGR